MNVFSKRLLAKATPKDRDDTPSRLLLQWHITERCNGHCIHCYQEDAPSRRDLDFAALTNILDQFLDLVQDCDRRRRGKTRAHVTVTGGEPFLREDFLDLLDLLAAHRPRLSFAVLTNGTLIDERLARFLALLQPRFVQVSLDGGQPTHDSLRGSGNFDQACAGTGLLTRHGVRTMVSFTAHRGNYREFPEVVRVAEQLGVDVVWADRFVPLGRSEAMRDLVLSSAETAEFVDLLSAVSKRSFWRTSRHTTVATHRALQSLNGRGHPYSCTAGSTLITVMSNGDLVPCRRMPVVIGNVLERRLRDLYWESDILQSLRRRETPIAGCEDCVHRDRCRGGLRCLSYAVTGNCFRADPGCWLANGRPGTVHIANPGALGAKV